MEDAKKATMAELDPAQRAKEVQMQGGTDLDTTDQDKPAGLERSGNDLIGEEDGEHGPGDGVLTGGDPTAEDPFVPGTGEAPDNFDPDSLLSDREKHGRDTLKAQDPKGENGPTYEVHQGTNFTSDGGSVDRNDSLTEETSGNQR